MSRYTDQDLVEAIASSQSWRGVLAKLGLATTNNSRVKSKAESLGLDYSHFKGKSWRSGTGEGKDKAKQAAAQRRYYARNGTAVKFKNAERRRATAAYIANLKATTPCADCKVQYPSYVMDFDHVTGDKCFNVSEMLSHSIEAVNIESAKCEIVCSNCHRQRTHTRKSS